MMRLGHLYRDGFGVVFDPAEAVRLYTLAADKGDLAICPKDLNGG